jgi:hypothetical protein
MLQGSIPGVLRLPAGALWVRQCGVHARGGRVSAAGVERARGKGEAALRRCNTLAGASCSATNNVAVQPGSFMSALNPSALTALRCAAQSKQWLMGEQLSIVNATGVACATWHWPVTVLGCWLQAALTVYQGVVQSVSWEAGGYLMDMSQVGGQEHWSIVGYDHEGTRTTRLWHPVTARAHRRSVRAAATAMLVDARTGRLGPLGAGAGVHDRRVLRAGCRAALGAGGGPCVPGGGAGGGMDGQQAARCTRMHADAQRYNASERLLMRAWCAVTSPMSAVAAVPPQPRTG